MSLYYVLLLNVKYTNPLKYSVVFTAEMTGIESERFGFKPKLV